VLIYDVRGPAKIELARHGPIGVEEIGSSPIDAAEAPEDGKWHEVQFAARKRGLYRITWSERLAGTQVKWLPTMSPSTYRKDRMGGCGASAHWQAGFGY
jgi:hypothetical protein